MNEPEKNPEHEHTEGAEQPAPETPDEDKTEVMASHEGEAAAGESEAHEEAGHAPAEESPQTQEAADEAMEPKFSAEEIKGFRKADKTAGAAIVLLMAAVFTVGFFLYLIVALQVGLG